LRECRLRRNLVDDIGGAGLATVHLINNQKALKSRIIEYLQRVKKRHLAEVIHELASCARRDRGDPDSFYIASSGSCRFTA
jgi:hypothetical protein